jgi:Flp pilus assembly pilin Flp
MVFTGPTLSLKTKLADVVGDDGQGLVEYALILAFVVVVAIVALTFLGSDVSQAISNIGNSL